MNKQEEINKISELIKTQTKEQLKSLLEFDTEKHNSCEFELLFRNKILELGRTLFEKTIPLIYGDGYEGSKIDFEGEEYNCLMRKRKKKINTIFGKIETTSAYYYSEELGNCISFLDKKLDVHNYQKSAGLRYFANLTGVVASFKESKQLLETLSNISISSSEIDVLTQEKGKQIEKTNNKKIENIENDCNGKINPAKIKTTNIKPKRTIYIETDGCQVPLKNQWSECKTFMFFEIEKQLKKNRKGEEIETNLIKNKKYFSTMKNSLYLKKQLKVAVEEYCLDDEVEIVCLGDGAKWIWKMFSELFPENSTHILDWYHVAEKTGEIARKFYKEDEKKEEDIEILFKELREYFYKSEYDDGIEFLNSLYEKTKDKELMGKIQSVIGYFDNNKERMDYKKYRENNFCIGSGSIESANKYVVQKRVKLPGCKWVEENVNGIVQLRTLYVNEEFDEFFGINRDFVNGRLSATT